MADGQHVVESKYDKVFNPGTMQYEIFKFVTGKWYWPSGQVFEFENIEDTNSVWFWCIDSVKDVTKGFNSTIFAYGQTGSGKTYTMFGPHWDDNN